MFGELVTFDELCDLLGANYILIEEMIMNGLPYYHMNRNYKYTQKFKIENNKTRHKSKLFNYEDVCDWIWGKLI